CDEDDDFFINDSDFSKNMSLFQQLMMLQNCAKNFKALSLQIMDDNLYIIKELAEAVIELLSSRKILLIFCCNLDAANQKDIQNIKQLIKSHFIPELLNFSNSEYSHITGATTLISGLLIAQKWGLKVHFRDGISDTTQPIAFAEREKVFL